MLSWSYPTNSVAGKLVGELGPYVVERTPGVALRGGAGAGLLLRHLGIEAVDIDVASTGALGDLDGKVDGETEGVMQHEGSRAGKPIALGERRELLVEIHATVV